MKKLFLSLALCSAAAATFAQHPNSIASIPIGSPIPAAGIEMQATNGKMVTLEQAKTGKGLLVMFSCNTCPYVIKSQQRTREAIALAAKAGIGMVIVNSNEAQRSSEDSYSAMTEYGQSQNYTVPYVRDDNSQLANEFGASHTPEVYLFDARGKLVYKGAMEDNPSDPAHSKQMYLASAVKNMLAGKKIAPAETKSIGCGIKRLQR